jgi:hypothetical protein
VAANSNAITGLQSTVSQQGNTLTSQGQSITRLQNDLSTANGNIAKKLMQRRCRACRTPLSSTARI